MAVEMKMMRVTVPPTRDLIFEITIPGDDVDRAALPLDGETSLTARDIGDPRLPVSRRLVALASLIQSIEDLDT